MKNFLILMMVLYSTSALSYQEYIGNHLLQCSPPPKGYSYNYTQISKNNLQTASMTLIPSSKTGPTITLLGVAHFGEISYFRNIQEILDGADLAIYESGIDPEKAKRIGDYLQNELVINNEDCQTFIKLTSASIYKESLSLEYQSSHIRYDKSTFVRVDDDVLHVVMPLASKYLHLNTTEDFLNTCKAYMDFFRETVREVPENTSFGEFVHNITVNYLKKKGREGFAKSVVMEESNVLSFSDDLTTSRNNLVIDYLKKIDVKNSRLKSIVVLYGALHMNPLQNEIIQTLDYVPYSKEWITAFSY